MGRPALSASRSSDVIDFLASFPERGFTLSEIMRATRINVASCHAVLGALTQCGYLTRSAQHRTYTLGPALVAIGQAALRSQPLIARAKAAAESLRRELGTAVLLTAVVENEILAIASLPGTSGRHAGLQVGERKPLIAPLGAPFLAWSSEEEIEAWIARHATALDRKLAKEWRQTLALTRKRGYQVVLRTPDNEQTAALMARMSSGSRAPEYKDDMARLVRSMDHQMTQPEILVPKQLYDVMLISAPLFDQSGMASYNLSLGSFPTKLSGASIVDDADRLVRTCVGVMTADREQGSRQERGATQAGTQRAKSVRARARVA